MISDMLAAGSRYKHLGNYLGHGIVFVLGCKQKDPTWISRVGKSGPDFKAVVSHLKETEVGRLAGELDGLCQLIIEDRLRVLDGLTRAYPPLPTAPVTPIASDDFNFNEFLVNQDCAAASTELDGLSSQ